MKKFVLSYLNILTPEMKDATMSLLPPDFEFKSLSTNSVEEKIATSCDADFIFVGDETVPRIVLESAKRVKLIQKLGSGVDRIDITAATSLKIPVAVAPGLNAISVTEHTILLILAVFRRLPYAWQKMRENIWTKSELRFTTYEFSGKTLALIGAGYIGREVARRAKAFGARVIYYDKFRLAREKELDLGIEFRTFENVLKEADVLSLHVPRTPETQGLIGEEEFKMMKKTCILINTSRGRIVNENDLVNAIQTGEIAGAGIDVFATEPPPRDNRLLQLENVIATPHAAGVTYDAYINTLKFGYKNIWRVIRSEPLADGVIVNPAVYS